ncbi:redox-sensing transcriptional repressor Rex [Eubacterium sp.]|uniref:redox-sensing transcriptional repressor Rex n=1 Tax=Eubacterium sp. TaxID=142586 RepID=UPI0025FD7BE8|nr:redox-sensing transcriptional repressor Rex [Eubacterium sp.]MCR5628642.1 redox-sensing transcriptional repressor Rex [Eubacterium sp.]
MKSISKAVISRLPRYYRYLGELKEEGIERISSGDLSERMHVTASQIRQDLNNFGGFGQQGYGYNVSYLYDEIGKILNLDKDHSMVIIGAGHLGQAIANYANFEKRGFKVIALFDKNPEVIGKIIRNVEVLDIDGLENYLNNNKIDIVALTLPKEQATKIADTLVACGIKAIWNFAHTDLELPDDVIVENVHLSESLMKLAYNYGEIENR